VTPAGARAASLRDAADGSIQDCFENMPEIVAKPGLVAALCMLLACYLAGAAAARLMRLSTPPAPRLIAGPLQ
jgi:hypothetical protein